MKRVVGVGAGGHAKVVIDILRLLGAYELVGLLDPNPELRRTNVLGVRVLGDDNLLPKMWSDGVRHAFIGLGAIAGTQHRRRLYEMVRRYGFEIVEAVHPQAVLAASADIGHGPTVMANAVIGAAARLGDDVIVNTSAVVEHDCVVGNHVHIATGARLAGSVRVGDGALIGLGACVRQSINIGRNSIVGAGAVVVDDVPECTVVVGIPARSLRKVGSCG